MSLCKFCEGIIHWCYQNGQWRCFDDMCHWYLHECREDDDLMDQLSTIKVT